MDLTRFDLLDWQDWFKLQNLQRTLWRKSVLSCCSIRDISTELNQVSCTVYTPTDTVAYKYWFYLLWWTCRNLYARLYYRHEYSRAGGKRCGRGPPYWPPLLEDNRTFVATMPISDYQIESRRSKRSHPNILVRTLTKLM